MRELMQATARHRLSIAALWVSAALSVYGLALLAVTFLPPGLLIGDLRQFAGGGGDPALELAARFGTIAHRARLAGAGLLLLAALACLFRYRIVDWLARRLGDKFSLSWRPRIAGRAALEACRARPWAVGTAVAIFMAGVALRLAYLNRGMRHDEAWTYMFYARMPAYLIPVRYSEVNDHVLNTLLVHFSTALFGDSAPAVRLPALLFGIFCIPAGYGLARALAGRGAAVVTAALIATATPLIEFSVNARGYTALTFFFLCALWAGHGAVTGRRLLAWPVFIICGALGIYTVPTMMIPLFGAMVWLCLLALLGGARVDRPALIDIVLAGCLLVLATLLLYLPILVVNGVSPFFNSPGIHAAKTVAHAVGTLPGYAAALLANWGRGFGPVFSSALVVLAALSVVLAPRGGRALALLILAMACALAAQLIGLKDVGPYRIWLPFLPVWLLLAAVSIDRLLGFVASAMRRPALAPSLSLAAAACLCCLVGANTLAAGMILTSDETAYFPEAKLAARGLERMQPGDVVGITNMRSDDIYYYTHRLGLDLMIVKVGARLRYFIDSPRGGQPPTPAPDARKLYLVIDGKFDACRGSACAARAAPDWPAGIIPGPLENLPGGQDFVFMRTALP